MCPEVWAFLLKRRPQGLGLQERLRSVQGFCLALRGMDVHKKLAMAVGVHAVSRAVAQARNYRHQSEAEPLLRLHAREGLRVSKAYRELTPTQG